MADIRVENLGFSYGDKRIFEDIDLHVEKKQFVGLIGPNGCGKSTLLKNVYRLYHPEMGDIRIDGKDVNSIKHKAFAKKMAVVFQEGNHQFDFSVKEIVTMGRFAHKKLMENESKNDHRIVSGAIERVGLSGFEDRCFLSLSGGEKQRVLIARALAQQSEIIVLDEPTNHLDIKYQLQVMEIIKSLNITTFTAVHDFNIAAQYCDYIYVMKDGQIHSAGTPEKTLTEAMFNEVFGVKSLIQNNPCTKKLHVSFFL